jgi:demethylmenaquinone methyltransferase/2-methoxy-6-polyprenyl-1,4-benzoquinol methylase
MMFDAIADNYDFTNKVMSLGSDISWRTELIKALELQEGDTVLDLATGTAEVAIALAQTTARPRVVGVDPSNRMLHHGRHKVRVAGLSGQGSGTVELFQGDAQKLEGFTTQAFDKSCISFGIRNVPNRALALKE